LLKLSKKKLKNSMPDKMQRERRLMHKLMVCNQKWTKAMSQSVKWTTDSTI